MAKVKSHVRSDARDAPSMSAATDLSRSDLTRSPPRPERPVAIQPADEAATAAMSRRSSVLLQPTWTLRRDTEPFTNRREQPSPPPRLSSRRRDSWRTRTSNGCQPNGAQARGAAPVSTCWSSASTSARRPGLLADQVEVAPDPHDPRAGRRVEVGLGVREGGGEGRAEAVAGGHPRVGCAVLRAGRALGERLDRRARRRVAPRVVDALAVPACPHAVDACARVGCEADRRQHSDKE